VPDPIPRNRHENPGYPPRSDATHRAALPDPFVLPPQPRNPPRPPAFRPQRTGMGSALAIAGLIVVVLIFAIVLVSHLRTGENGEANNSTIATVPSSGSPTFTLPYGATLCATEYPRVHEFQYSASGNDHTTCPFAINVRESFLNSPQTTPITVYAYSPATRLGYDMFCTGEYPVVCRGGNDAVVYIY